MQLRRAGCTEGHPGRLPASLTLVGEHGDRASGRLAKQIAGQLAKLRLLILDDFGLVALTARGRSDLLELLDDRVGGASTIVAGQMPVKEWHAFINDPALADAILDRLFTAA
jgi:DNA replication protein